MQSTNDVISGVFCQIIEDLAFMFGDHAERDEVQAEGEAFMAASIEFRGHKQGKLCLQTTHQLATELAANVLGIEPDDDDAIDQACDALGELLNVVLGRLLTELEGDAPVFDLSAPQVDASITRDQWQAMLDDPETVAFTIDDQPVILRYTPSVA